ncbi:hypothetical protein NEOKW01_2121 [Nematocida sp. AWRm80]|nr:hypothetical protein NEOKW01_2121 [Nematocida sp. AWRm80]
MDSYTIPQLFKKKQKAPADDTRIDIELHEYVGTSSAEADNSVSFEKRIRQQTIIECVLDHKCTDLERKEIYQSLFIALKTKYQNPCDYFGLSYFDIMYLLVFYSESVLLSSFKRAIKAYHVNKFTSAKERCIDFQLFEYLKDNFASIAYLNIQEYKYDIIATNLSIALTHMHQEEPHNRNTYPITRFLTNTESDLCDVIDDIYRAVSVILSLYYSIEFGALFKGDILFYHHMLNVFLLFNSQNQHLQYGLASRWRNFVMRHGLESDSFVSINQIVTLKKNIVDIFSLDTLCGILEDSDFNDVIDTCFNNIETCSKEDLCKNIQFKILYSIIEHLGALHAIIFNYKGRPLTHTSLANIINNALKDASINETQFISALGDFYIKLKKAKLSKQDTSLKLCKVYTSDKKAFAHQHHSIDQRRSNAFRKYLLYRPTNLHSTSHYTFSTPRVKSKLSCQCSQTLLVYIIIVLSIGLLLLVIAPLFYMSVSSNERHHYNHSK